MVVVVELGPIQHDHDLFTNGHDELHPLLLDRFDVDANVAQQTIDLLDAALGLDPRQQRVCLADGS
jgi:hypothetical protein